MSKGSFDSSSNGRTSETDFAALAGSPTTFTVPRCPSREMASASPRPRSPVASFAACWMASETPPACATSTLASPTSCTLRYAVRRAATFTAVVPMSIPRSVLM